MCDLSLEDRLLNAISDLEAEGNECEAAAVRELWAAHDEAVAEVARLRLLMRAEDLRNSIAQLTITTRQAKPEAADLRDALTCVWSALPPDAKAALDETFPTLAALASDGYASAEDAQARAIREATEEVETDEQ